MLICVFGGVGCNRGQTFSFPGRQYILELDAKDARKHQICHRDAGDEVADAAPPECHPFTASPLDTPGTLTVMVKNRDPNKTYDLRVSSFTTEATPQAAGAVIDKVVNNLTELATLGAERGVKGVAEQSKPAGDVARAIVDKALAKSPALAEAVKGSLATKPPALAEVHDPDVIFSDYLDEGSHHLRGAAEMGNGERLITNAPTDPSPPPRTTHYNDQDIAFLAKHGVGVPELAAHTIAWCRAGSFDTATVRWQERLKTKIDTGAVKAALGLTPEEVARSILGNTDAYRIKEAALLDEARDHWETASPAAKSYLLMHWAVAIAKDLSTCTANFDYLAGYIHDTATLTAVAKTRDEIQQFQAALKPATDAYSELAPVFEQAGHIVAQVLNLDGETFSSFSLQVGTLDLGLGEKSGADRREIGTYKMDVRGVEKLAITIGPAVLWRGHSFEKLQIKTSPSDATTMGMRQLVQSSSSREYAVVAALHTTMWSTKTTGLGLLIGYPLTQPADTAKSALIGVGVRRSSLQLGFGAHFFAVKRLVPAYAHKTPIDLDAPGNQALSIDDVSEDKLQWSWFAYFGYSKSI